MMIALVMLLQQHKYSSYCRRNKTCRFNFPKPPSCKTLITKDDVEPDDVTQALTVLAKVQKLIADGNTDLSLIFAYFVDAACIPVVCIYHGVLPYAICRDGPEKNGSHIKSAQMTCLKCLC